MRMKIANDKYDFEQVLIDFNREKCSISNFLDDKFGKESSLDLTDSKVNTSNLFNKLDEEFSVDFLKTKDKILDQVKEKKEEKIAENIEEEMREDQFNQEINEENIENQEEEKVNLQKLNEETIAILTKKKKGIVFDKFTEKIKEKIENIHTADVFYNSLLMAQNMDIEINQTNSFDNTSIVLRLYK
jgi:hypothetical protein